MGDQDAVCPFEQYINAWRNRPVRVFCWLPTKVFSGTHTRAGFRWLSIAWYCPVTKRHYTTPMVARIGGAA